MAVNLSSRLWLKVWANSEKEITGAAQDLGQLGQESEKEIAGAVGPLVGGNQTGNQSGGMLGQLGEQAKSMLPGQ